MLTGGMAVRRNLLPLALLMVAGGASSPSAAQTPPAASEEPVLRSASSSIPGVGVIFGTDDRVPVNDPAVARIMAGCTGWIVSNGAFLTAGHCVTSAASDSLAKCPTTIKISFKAVQFGVPLSNDDGTINAPPAQDEYPIEIKTPKIQCELLDSGTYSKDWAVFAVGKNKFGQYPIENQKSFFRVTNLANLPPANTSLVRVTGYGLDGPPPNYGNDKKDLSRNRYNKTEQTAAGQYLGSSSSSSDKTFINLRYKVDTSIANSGSPVILNGTSLALGIHDGAPSTTPPSYNEATSFQVTSLANALQAFPGTLVSPTIPGANIFYVDAFSPAYASVPTGNLFQPFPTLTAAFVKIATVPTGTATLISVVTGSYPETIDETTTNTVDITVTLKGDSTLVLPVGDVTLWDTMQVPYG